MRPSSSSDDDDHTTTVTSPETLMSDINRNISNLEYARATYLLDSTTTTTSTTYDDDDNVTQSQQQSIEYDVRIADEAYRDGCAAIAAGKLDDALQSLNVSLSKCPPSKTSALAKLQSLISLTANQLQRSSSPSN
ncbi:hypothetical protein ACFE04_007192 [Oxalis oulophora]